MRALWPQLGSWIDRGEPFALATVTTVSGSAPRAPGSCMALAPDSLRFLGSVSSGCLDVEIVEAASSALASTSSKELRFGPDGSPPWTDGLTCGGWIAVRVEPWWGMHPRAEIRRIVPEVRDWLALDRPGVVLSRGEVHAALDLDGASAGDVEAFSTDTLALARQRLSAEEPPAIVMADGHPVFIRTIRRRPRLVVIGAPDIAARLVAFAREAGFATILIEPRTAYLNEERFPVRPDRIERAWPQAVIGDLHLGPRDAAVAITHDPKIDDPAILALLGSRVGYLGAMGSSRSHAGRLERLRDQGADGDALARIHGPAGIHLGTPDAAGIALGILAGVLRWQAKEERHRAGATV